LSEKFLDGLVGFWDAVVATVQYGHVVNEVELLVGAELHAAVGETCITYSLLAPYLQSSVSVLESPLLRMVCMMA
jgi:hypothetical protein